VLALSVKILSEFSSEQRVFSLCDFAGFTKLFEMEFRFSREKISVVIPRKENISFGGVKNQELWSCSVCLIKTMRMRKCD
jgi:hypothetical protein